MPSRMLGVKIAMATIARLSRPIRKCCGSFQKSASPACLPAKQAFCMCIAVIGGMRFLTRSKLRFRRASRPSICVRRMLPVILKYLNEPVALQKWAALSISPRAAAAGWDPLRTRLSRRSKRMFARPHHVFFRRSGFDAALQRSRRDGGLWRWLH